MLGLLTGAKRAGPIGVDVGARSVKLVQFTHDRAELIDAARWDLPAVEEGETPPPDAVAEAIRRAREGRRFRGREAVLCLSGRRLFLQNVRVPKSESEELDQAVHQEAAGRLPFPVSDSEIRYLEAADVRQAGGTLREVILIAALRTSVEEDLSEIEGAGLVPVSLDAEPLALLRGYASQFRREEDSQQRTLFVHLGYSRMVAIIAEGEQALFIKYIDLGGKQFDDAAARGLGMRRPDAVALRRHNGDRRSEQQDPEIARSIAQAVRPVIEKLVGELSMCVRYHSVTFRGKALGRMVLGGWEATPGLAETLAGRLNLKCDLSHPFRHFPHPAFANRPGQWDVAAGLALRTIQPGA
ncbi:MAG: pilus assembly protein PilM [Planctomycetes bacterium]|nr:pilus assembly protein PilM [Planctomycetota bacterium]